MEPTNRIIQTANTLFFKWGIKGVSMDQIASELGISKRTLYENFKDKDSLVLGVLDRLHEEHRTHLENIVAQDISELQKLLYMFTQGQKMNSKINPLFFQDLRRFYFPIYEEVFSKKKKESDTLVFHLYQSAQQQGYFAADVDMRIVYKFICDMMEDRLNYLADGSFPIDAIQRNILRPFMLGISTSKGRAAFRKSVEAIDKNKNK